MRTLFWKLIDHEHVLVGHPEVVPPLRCKKCKRQIVFDGEWNTWITLEDDAAKQKRKADFSEAVGKLHKR